MHKIFGVKENATYLDQEDAYLIPIKDSKKRRRSNAKGIFSFRWWHWQRWKPRRCHLARVSWGSGLHSQHQAKAMFCRNIYKASKYRLFSSNSNILHWWAFRKGARAYWKRPQIHVGWVWTIKRQNVWKNAKLDYRNSKNIF